MREFSSVYDFVDFVDEEKVDETFVEVDETEVCPL